MSLLFNMLSRFVISEYFLAFNLHFQRAIRILPSSLLEGEKLVKQYIILLFNWSHLSILNTFSAMCNLWLKYSSYHFSFLIETSNCIQTLLFSHAKFTEQKKKKMCFQLQTLKDKLQIWPRNEIPFPGLNTTVLFVNTWLLKMIKSGCLNWTWRTSSANSQAIKNPLNNTSGKQPYYPSLVRP